MALIPLAVIPAPPHTNYYCKYLLSIRLSCDSASVYRNEETYVYKRYVEENEVGG